MAETTTRDEGGDLPPISLPEIGYNGLKVVSGRVQEECDGALSWPRCVNTFKKMAKDGTIAPALDYVQIMLAQVLWYVSPPKGKEKDTEDKVKYLESIKNDCEQSWLTFIKQAASFVKYGFSVFETVPRIRLYSKGSKYNDGYYGLKKLAHRSQDTILGWNYRDKGRSLKEIVQKVNIPTNKSVNGQLPDFKGLTDINNTEKKIPVERILLFRNNPEKDSPIGISPLVGCHEAYLYKKSYEQAEAHGVQADMHGFKVLEIPAQYLKQDASAEDKETLEHFKSAMRSMHIGEESGLILPNVVDPISGEPQFKFSVISLTGAKSYDVNKIIARYQREILTNLYASFLTLGQEGSGSYALSESLMDFVKMVINSKLEEIRDVLNHVLIPRLYRWNGWPLEDMPTFEYGEVKDETLEEFSKAIQRIGAVNLIAITPQNVNTIAERLRLPTRVSEDLSTESLKDLLGSNETGSAEGLSSGMPSGTGKSNKNNSSTNNDNKA